MSLSRMSVDRLKSVRRYTAVVAINLFFMALSVGYKIFASIDSEALSCHVFESLLIPCPTCGGSRSVFYLLEFKPVKAFLYYPPIYYFISVILYFDIKETVAFIRNQRPKYGKDSFILITLIPVTIISFFFIRAALLFLGTDLSQLADSLNY